MSRWPYYTAKPWWLVHLLVLTGMALGYILGYLAGVPLPSKPPPRSRPHLALHLSNATYNLQRGGLRRGGCIGLAHANLSNTRSSIHGGV